MAAYTYYSYTGDGVTNNPHTFGFNYRSTDDIVVKIGGSLQVEGAGNDYTFPNATQVQMTAAVPDGSLLTIERNTSQDTKLVVFTAGTLTSIDLNAIVEQLFFMAQEALSGIVAGATINNAANVTYNPAGAAAIATNVQTKLRELVSAKDFGAAGDGVTDDTAAIQAALDSLSTSGGTVYLPQGNYLITDTVYLNANDRHLIGAGFGATIVTFSNASGGTAFAGDSGKSTSTNVYTYCSLKDFSMIRAAGTNGENCPDICVDLTSFSYSEFNLRLETRRANAKCYYGQGNTGSSPYYNKIEGYMFGGNTNTQIGLQFAQGTLGDEYGTSSNGGNGNIIQNIQRAAALKRIFDIKAGNGNQFSHIIGETINDAYFVFADNPATDSGTSTGSNTANKLIDTGAAWTTNEHVNAGVKITGGTGSGQVRKIASNTATQLTLQSAWAVLPDNTSTYEIYAAKASNNCITHVRTEGDAASNPDFIQAKPSVSGIQATHCIVGSLGSGVYVRDESGTSENVWFTGCKVAFTENIQNPGTSANIDVYVKNSTFGGVSLPENFVVIALFVSTSTQSFGDTLTTTLDVGGASVGAGDVTLQCIQDPNDNIACAYPAPGEFTSYAPSSKRVFLNVQTGASFSATADVQITWVAILI